jgi:serine/threonine protein kinase
MGNQVQRQRNSKGKKQSQNLKSLISTGEFEDKYVLKEEIGRGTWGTVHRGVDINTGMMAAIKKMKLPDEYETDPSLLPYEEEIDYMQRLCSDPSMKLKIPPLRG